MNPPLDPFARLAELATRPGPLMVILVGPNGSGKSTFYQRHLSAIPLPFVNADVLARTLVDAGAPGGESTERLAAELAEKKRRELIADRRSFVTETVFSDPVGAKVKSLRDARDSGYTVVLVFVCVDSPELTALRVRSRVQDGGHDVPHEKIISRYHRMRANVRASLAFVDFAVIVDNSSFRTPHRPVAATAGGSILMKNPPLPWWAEEVLAGLDG